MFLLYTLVDHFEFVEGKSRLRGRLGNCVSCGKNCVTSFFVCVFYSVLLVKWKQADQFGCCDGFPRIAPNPVQSAVILERGRKAETKMSDYNSECNCSRFRLGSDGNSSEDSWSDSEGQRELDYWQLRIEVDCEWPLLEREIQVCFRPETLSLVPFKIRPRFLEDGGRFLEIEAKFSERSGIPCDVRHNNASDSAAFGLMGRSAALSPARCGLSAFYRGAPAFSAFFHLRN